jgi:nucleotide-binding universal stress UspA family protein
MLMRAPDILLLAHHGTAGAARAEAFAFAIAEPGRTTIVHALVVPDFWDGMQGDDWLNNASTRDTFAKHLETQLEAESRQQIEALSGRCTALGLASRSLLAVGDPATRLVEMAAQCRAGMVVIGPPRPRGTPGYRSRMKLETLARDLACPLVIAR